MDFDEEVRAAQARRAQQDQQAAQLAAAQAASAGRRAPATVLQAQVGLKQQVPEFATLCDAASRFFAAVHPVSCRRTLVTLGINAAWLELVTGFSDGSTRREAMKGSGFSSVSGYLTAGTQGGVAWMPIGVQEAKHRLGFTSDPLDEIVRSSSAVALVVGTGPPGLDGVVRELDAFWFLADGRVYQGNPDQGGSPVTALVDEGHLRPDDLAGRAARSIRVLAESSIEPPSWAVPAVYEARSKSFRKPSFLDQFKPW